MAAGTLPSPLQTRSLREQVYDYLREAMNHGELQPNAFLDLNALAERLGISRTPLREALLQLETQGFVTVLPRRGFRLNRLSLDDIRHYNEILGALEAATLKAHGAALLPGDVRRMRELNAAMAQAVAALLDRIPLPDSGIPRLAVAHLRGDPTGEVTQEVRRFLDARGRWDVAHPSLSERVRRKLVATPLEAGDLSAAQAYARARGSEWVLWGAVLRLSQDPTGTAAQLDLLLNDAQTGAVRWRETIQREDKSVSVSVALPPAIVGCWSRVGVFLWRVG